MEPLYNKPRGLTKDNFLPQVEAILDIAKIFWQSLGPSLNRGSYVDHLEWLLPNVKFSLLAVNSAATELLIRPQLDNAIHRINHYPLDSAIAFPNTYPLDSDSSGGLRYPTFEQLEPEG